MMKKITVKIKRPNDCHVHLRRGKMLQKVLPFHNIFGHAIVMGNTLPNNIETDEDAATYREEIMLENPKFIPHMTIMLTRDTTVKTIKQAHKRGIRLVKYIPAATSTGSSAEKGIPLWMLSDYYPIIETIWKNDMHLLLHIELAFNPENGKVIPYSERERLGIPYLGRLAGTFPRLKITVEHVSTKEMIFFINRMPDNVRATITAHHIGPYYNCNVLLGFDLLALQKGDVGNSNIFCLPILKDVDDVDAIIKAMTSGDPKYMFGSDSAPHPPEHKTLDKPKPGIFSAPTALSWITTVFSLYANMNVDLLNAFLHDNSCQWYGFPRSSETIALNARKWKVPENYKGIIPFLAGEELLWKVSE
jgi:dihydroorotase